MNQGKPLIKNTKFKAEAVCKLDSSRNKGYNLKLRMSLKYYFLGGTM